MDYKILDIKTDENIIIVTINRPKALNALNRQTMLELNHFFGDVSNVGKASGVILTGAGEKSFVAGADISEFTSMSGNDSKKFAQFGHDTFRQIEEFPKPVIAAVNGFALGGGCELAMACHIRVASSVARFGQPEVNLGIIPGYGGTQRLIQLIGKGKALEYMMTADMIKANEALSFGLANHVVEPEQLIEKCREILQKIGTKAPVAITKVIECTNAYFDKNKDGFEAEVEKFVECTVTSDFLEGATAFLEKRKADFQGK